MELWFGLVLPKTFPLEALRREFTLLHPLGPATNPFFLESWQWCLHETFALLSLELTSKPPWFLLPFSPFLFGLRFGLGFGLCFHDWFSCAHHPKSSKVCSNNTCHSQTRFNIPLCPQLQITLSNYLHMAKPHPSYLPLLIYKPIHRPITLWLILTPMGGT